MIVRRAAAAPAVLLAVLACTGCGGDDKPRSDRDQVRDVVERFDEAFSSGDYGTSCELMHSHRRGQLEEGRGQDCEEILAEAADSSGSLVKALGKARVTEIQLLDDFAVVSVEGETIGASQAMVERDGDRGWRLSESAAGF
jgi:hypothetical protein